jgi:hypothetical protein
LNKINRTKLIPKVLVGLAVLTTILGLSTAARAGAPPFIWEYFQYNVISYGWDVEIPQDEPCLWGVASACTEEEIETGFFPKPPFNHKVSIDGEKIVLRRFVFYDEYGYIFGIPETKWYCFYHVFEAGYFDLGEHDVIHEAWVQKPYAGSEIYGWRIFVNYEGPEYLYGSIGVPYSLTYTLTVI